jgi:hypothetical protein
MTQLRRTTAARENESRCWNKVDPKRAGITRAGSSSSSISFVYKRQLTLLLLLVVVTVNKPIKTECARTSRRRWEFYNHDRRVGGVDGLHVDPIPPSFLPYPPPPPRGLLIQRRKASATLFMSLTIDVFFFPPSKFLFLFFSRFFLWLLPTKFKLGSSVDAEPID